jgi:hypothetical protein
VHHPEKLRERIIHLPSQHCDECDSRLVYLSHLPACAGLGVFQQRRFAFGGMNQWSRLYRALAEYLRRRGYVDERTAYLHYRLRYLSDHHNEGTPHPAERPCSSDRPQPAPGLL